VGPHRAQHEPRARRRLFEADLDPVEDGGLGVHLDDRVDSCQLFFEELRRFVSMYTPPTTQAFDVVLGTLGYFDSSQRRALKRRRDSSAEITRPASISMAPPASASPRLASPLHVLAHGDCNACIM